MRMQRFFGAILQGQEPRLVSPLGSSPAIRLIATSFVFLSRGEAGRKRSRDLQEDRHGTAADDRARNRRCGNSDPGSVRESLHQDSTGEECVVESGADPEKSHARTKFQIQIAGVSPLLHNPRVASGHVRFTRAKCTELSPLHAG